MRSFTCSALLCASGVALTFVIATTVVAAGDPDEKLSKSPADQLNAIELVQRIVADEKKVEQIQSLYLRFKGKWTHPPEAIAASRAELQKKFPGTPINEKRFAQLRPEMTEELELAFDEHRVRYYSHWHEAQVDLRAWDGKRATMHTKYFTHDQEHYAFDKEPMRHIGSSMFMDMSWLRMAPYSFWWFRQEMSDEQQNSAFGVPDDYIVARKRDYRGRKCVELKSRRTPQRRLYVGLDDQRLHAIIQLGMSNPSEVKATMARIAGREFKDEAEMEAWSKNLTAVEQQTTFNRLLDEGAHPSIEHYLDEYRDIGAGLWFPAKQGYILYDNKDWSIGTKRDLELVEASVNKPLADELFKIEMRDGVQVNDWGHDPSLFYKQKADRTSEEWQEIVKKHEAENKEWQDAETARNALVGKPAPEFPESNWLNSEPLSWKSLRGKVVLVHFWACWCGPCHNDLPILAGIHKNAAKQNLVVIGVHNPGSEIADIEQDVKKNELGYPILVDVPRGPNQPQSWGKLSNQLGVNAIPHAILVDGDGTIVAQGQLNEVLKKAYEITAETNK